MESADSQTNCQVNLYFVVPNKYEANDDCNEDMWHAFNKCCDNDLEPRWINEDRCKRLTPGKQDVFVMEEFEGEGFEYLKTSKCSRIVGPRCLFICFLNAEPIPEGTSPIFTVAMRGLVISASGFSSEQKDEMEKTVEYMGGIFTKRLRCSVTHLITNSVMSAKYEKAIEMNISIMTENWVKAVWETNLKDFVKADDAAFDKYKCPVFRNLVVTSTNLSKRKKDEIKHLIDENGGIFMGALDGSKVKVVLAPKECSLSDKLKYAMQNDIPCLSIEWVYESIKAGYALPCENYLIKSTKACSTPTRVNAHETLNFSSISTIQGEAHENNFIDETAMSAVSVAGLSNITTESVNAEYMRSLDQLTLSDAKMAGPFLDGCCIYLTGFTPSQRDKINRILNVGSATRLNDISDALTHVLVGDGNKAYADLKLIDANRLGPFVLNLKWLEESIKLKRPAPEERFLYEAKSSRPQKTAEPPSPLSKKNLQMLQKVKRPPIPPFLLDTNEPSAKDSNESDLVQQYLQKTVVPDKTMQEILQTRPSMSELKNDEGKVSKRDSANIAIDADSNKQKIETAETGRSRSSVNDSSIPISQGLSSNRGLFQDLTFIATGFAEDERQNLVSNIMSMGGQVVSNAFSGIPDFGVVPICGAPLKHTVNEIVTNLYINDCLFQEQLVDIEYYHRPLSINKSVKPLSNCVITMSMYTGAERTFLSALAAELGGRCQDTFARKRNVEKETYASTHLVCPTPEGNKYNAAVKWKFPAVTAEWLLECAVQGKYISETSFLVGETMAPENSESTRISETNSSISKVDNKESKDSTTDTNLPRNIITPRRHLVQKQEHAERETPLINKRLSLVMNKTPQSPFHVSTPSTPYGQIIKPNPSPATRKGWLEYIDDMLDIKVEEPPAKRRLPSTPLSELRRQFWDQVNKPINKTQDTADPSDDRACDAGPEDVTLKMNNVTRDTEENEKTPIKRRLDFPDEDNSVDNDEINQQIVQLQEAFQRTSSTPESRPLLSGDNTKRYYADTADHIEKCIVKESQPFSVGWEDPAYSVHQTSLARINECEELGNDNEKGEVDGVNGNNITREPTPPPKPKFMLSGIKDKGGYEEVIRKLGGDVSTEANFDSSASHLLCFRPSRNEKMLASIAAGKWVLHFLYLQHSEKAGRFLQEDKYEWGNPEGIGVIPEPEGSTEKAIAAAAYRWRLKLTNHPGGAFEDMIALLLVSSQKYDQFKRLIEAGGGKVVQAKPPYDTSPGKRITHCFVAQMQQQVDWAMMASKNILCFLPQYLCDYLTAESALNPRECVIPEFKKYLTLLPR